MIILLPKNKYKENLWKNGLGKTQEIAIYPTEAEVSANNFLWRISSATVTTPSPFSTFEGHERKLIVWQGAGLLLNNAPLLPFSPISFSGEEKIECAPIGDNPVVDLGIIFRPDQISAELKVVTFQAQSTFNLSPGIHFFFLAEGGEAIINNLKMQIGDTIKIENQRDFSLHVESQGKMVFIFLSVIEGLGIFNTIP